MGTINFISGGRTGDLLHSLMVVKSICEIQNKKALLYITDKTSFGGDGFHFDMNRTYNDLKHIIMSQKYIESFSILTDNDIIGDYVNLNRWRNSQFLFRLNWINLLCNTFQINQPSEPWMVYNKKEGLENTILIHRSTLRHTNIFPWEKIVKENNCTFVTNVETIYEYERFNFKNEVGLITCDTFSELITSINSCKFFIGNMSTPLAISHCLGKPHLGELFWPDSSHYIGEEKYLKNYFYISDNNLFYLDGINKFINL